jgi:hypothetical protein
MTPTGEVTHDIYYQKYLKYKAKYLELKRLLGGGSCGRTCPSAPPGRGHRYDKRNFCEYCYCKK